MTKTNVFGLTDKDVWMTKEGEILKMDEIGDSHLLNIIRLLRRRLVDQLAQTYRYIGGIQGEMAYDAALTWADTEYDQYVRRVDLFEAEAKKRKLTDWV